MTATDHALLLIVGVMEDDANTQLRTVLLDDRYRFPSKTRFRRKRLDRPEAHTSVS